jgi:histidyl-tRNA synthetase
MELQSLPGFRDFFPEECSVRNRIFAAWRAAAESYGFEPYDGPPLESLELYKKKSGDEIVGQLYHFLDKGEREVALRPEMTPTLARMICARGRSLKKPIKWYSIPQLFRYERQQKGRLREHFQLNGDIFGEPGVGADAELVALAIDALCRLGLGAGDFVVRVSDRKLLILMLVKLGVKEAQMAEVLSIVDKITREPAEVVEKKLEVSLSNAKTASHIISLFEIRELSGIEERFGGEKAISERILEIQRFFGILEAMDLGAYVCFDLSIVRGLLYYTGIVYEAFDRKGEFRAIFGGGRYDRLTEVVGGLEMPAAGFGMGDVVLTELLKARGKLPAPAAALDVFVVAVDEAMRTRGALPLARKLRQAGFSVEYTLHFDSVSRQFKQAGQRGARFSVVIGPDEWQKQSVKVKDMATGVETEVKADQLEAFLNQKSEIRN